MMRTRLLHSPTTIAALLALFVLSLPSGKAAHAAKLSKQRRRAVKSHYSLVQQAEGRKVPKKQLHPGFGPFAILRIGPKPESQTIEAWGYTAGGKRERLGFLYYLDKGYNLEIRDVSVEKDYRRRGLQTLMFKTMVDGSNAREVTLKNSFVGTNREAFAEALIERLQKVAEVSTDSTKPAAEQLNRYFRQALDGLPKKTRRALLREAAIEMPAYRTRARFGFTELGKVTCYLPEERSNSWPFYLSYSVRKP